MKIYVKLQNFLCRFALARVAQLQQKDMLANFLVIGFRKNGANLSVAVYRLISLSVVVLWQNIPIGGGVAIKLQDPLSCPRSFTVFY